MPEPIPSTSRKKLFDEIADLSNAHDVFYRMSAPNPDKIIMEKGRGLITYYDLMMDSDGILAGLIDTRIGAVAGLEWEIIPVSDDPADMKIAEFVRFVFGRLSKFKHDLSELLGALRIGYSISEIIWDEFPYEGVTKIIPVGLKSRRPDRFTFSSDYELLLKTPVNPQGEPVPDYKFLHFAYNTRYENPYGVSLLRACWWDYWFKHHAYKWWVKAAERGAVVTPVGTYPEHFNPSQIEEFEAALKKYMGDKYIAKPEGTEVDFPAIKIDPEFASKLTKATTEEMIFRIMGAIHAVAGDGGSLAKAETHDKRLQERIESDAEQLMAVIRDQLIWPAVHFNFPNVVDIPIFKLKYETSPDTIAVGKTLETAAGLGIPVSIDTAAGMLQIPIADEGDELIQPPITGRLPIEPSTEQDRQNTEEIEGGEEVAARQKINDCERCEGFGVLYVDGLSGKLSDVQEIICPDCGGKPSEITIKAHVIPQDKIPFSVRRRGEAQISKIKNLEAGAIEFGMPAYEQIGDQIEAWLSQFENVADAIAAVNQFTIDQSGLEDAIYESGFYSMLHGFHDVLNVPGVAEELEVENKRGRLVEFKVKFFNDLMRKIYARSEWIPIPPADAIELFEGRTILERADFDLLSAAARRHATTAAGMSVETIALRLQPSLMRALIDGVPMREFMDSIDDVVLSRWHAETIFRTNIQTAYNSGHAEALYHPDMATLIPAFEFIAVVDDRTTDICQERNGMIFSRSEMTSADVIPPCHFNCRSTIIGVNAGEWDGMTSGTPEIRSLEGFGRFTPILN